MKSKQLLVAVLALSLAGCAVFGKRKRDSAELPAPEKARVAFVQKAAADPRAPSHWQVKGSRKSRAQVYESVKNLTGLPLAETLADAGGRDVALLLERLRNARLEREQLEQTDLPREEKDKKLAAVRGVEDRATRRIQEYATEMKMALYASLLR